MIPGSANALLLGSAAGGYTISRSLRFNSADSAYLSRTPASAGNRKTWTWAGWVKRSKIAANQYFFGCNANTNNTDSLYFSFAEGSFNVLSYGYFWRTTTAVFRDPSAWYHVVVAVDTTQATANNRIRVYINGVEQTSFSTINNPGNNADMGISQASAHVIGDYAVSGGLYFNGYLADIHFIDGQALDPTSFGEFSATTGVWMPKAYTGSYGTNGFKLNFSDNSAATATTLGKDSSGNGNNWTPNNLSVTAGAGNDSLVDVPTNGSETDTGAGGQVRGNYCTWNPLDLVSTTLANGNLQASGSTDVAGVSGTIGISSGKWYWEVTAGSTYDVIGIWSTTSRVTSYPGDTSSSYGYFGSTGNKINSGAGSSYGATFTANDVIGVALDLDAGTLTFYKNGVSQSTAFSSLAGGFRPAVRAGNASGASTATYLNAGARQFAYTAPSGFKALCTANLPAPVVTKPTTVFDALTFTATNTNNTVVTGLGFQPSLVWGKSRTNAYDHQLYDAVRGVNKSLISNNTNAELSETVGVTSFNSNGFTAGRDFNAIYGSGASVAWCWDAGSSTVTNTQGSITSSVRANASAGFSIVTYTGNGNSSATIGHGLGVTPQFVIFKNRSLAIDWIIYHVSTGTSGYFNFDAAAVRTLANLFTGISSTTIPVNGGYASVNGNGSTYVAYCFAPVESYSAFGSYTGNGSTDGPFVYTGFRPRWVMVKASSSTGSWYIYDSKRDTYNVATSALFPNSNSNELSIPAMDLLSNGLKLKYEATYGANYNGSGVTYVYAAFSEVAFNFARAR